MFMFSEQTSQQCLAPASRRRRRRQRKTAARKFRSHRRSGRNHSAPHSRTIHLYRRRRRQRQQQQSGDVDDDDDGSSSWDTRRDSRAPHLSICLRASRRPERLYAHLRRVPLVGGREKWRRLPPAHLLAGWFRGDHLCSCNCSEGRATIPLPLLLWYFRTTRNGDDNHYYYHILAGQT